MERLTADLNIISTLADQPAMSARELKAKFDEAGNIIKNFLNDQLLDELEDWQTALNESITASMTNLENRVDSRLTTLETNLTSQMSNLDSSLRSYVDTKTSNVNTTLTNFKSVMNGALLIYTFRETHAWHDGVSGDHYRDQTFNIPQGYSFAGLISPFSNGDLTHTATFRLVACSSNSITVRKMFHASDRGEWTYGFSIMCVRTNSHLGSISLN